MRTKEVKFIRQVNGSVELKGDLDIEIAIDVFESLNEFDTAVLLSGDSDFAPKVVVISTRPHISRELARAADKFIDLTKFRRHWELKRR
ncbi:MAG: NYN domain-containing protein [Candidatus Cloacimonetes bacterium]|nr:NYN domain-containing protein [Candidatus Cloacimonadota bacterium]